MPIGGPDLVQAQVQEVKVRLQPRPLISFPVQVVPELRDFPKGQQFTLRPATVKVQVQCFPEDSARLDRTQVNVLLHYGQFHSPIPACSPCCRTRPRWPAASGS
ncbi:hypothetical protein [Hymenobacter cellulosilyticus]|uniref:Uncharacterized protein n=1 Tax=Hymenobacter cellulosilyticus TaxID=2932248 RepID=A0A8T9Q8H1_9BACT|nr:hypothetical protein [Hymenobacter cellulosilyticus]UOQ73435.1 hypothetical protein MUN79_05675 [Hymenobacter cellulosilyticus]